MASILPLGRKTLVVRLLVTLPLICGISAGQFLLLQSGASAASKKKVFHRASKSLNFSHKKSSQSRGQASLTSLGSPVIAGAKSGKRIVNSAVECTKAAEDAVEPLTEGAQSEAKMEDQVSSMDSNSSGELPIRSTGANQTVPTRTHAVSSPLPAVATTARIFAAPLLVAGKAAWMSIYDNDGSVKTREKVSINGTVLSSDDCGIVSYNVPQAEQLHIAILDADGRETTASITYTARANGLLVQDGEAACAFEKLEDLAQGEMSPRVFYAPPVVDKLSSFLVVGRNFSGSSGKDRVCLDGRDADLFAGSAACLLARAPEKTSLGPLKELFVLSDGEASNTREIDVCRIDTVRRDADNGSASQVKVVVCGTNMPCIVELAGTNGAHLRLKGHTVGSTATVVSPGGDANNLVFDIDGSTTTQISAILLADVLLEPSLMSGDENLRHITIELNKAQACRLQRRYVALDLRLTDAQARRDKASNNNVQNDIAEVEQLQNEIKSMSSRKDRLNRMILAQRALIEGEGGTSDDFKTALAAADGGITYDLETALRPLDLFPKSLTVARAVERKSKKLTEETVRENFPSAKQRVKAPVLANYLREFPAVASLPPKTPHMIAPPAPYVPDLQDLESYMVSSYMGPPPLLPVKPIVVSGKPVAPPPKESVMVRRGNDKRYRHAHSGRNGESSGGCRRSAPEDHNKPGVSKKRGNPSQVTRKRHNRK